MLQLCNPKNKVLNKEIKKPSLDKPGEKISINLAFKNNDIRVNVMPVLSKADKASKQTAQDSEIELGIKRERNQIIEAHLVKQMKTNKTMMYNDLV